MTENTQSSCCCGGGCGTKSSTDETQEQQTAQKKAVDVQFDVHEDAKFATLLMLVPMLTLSAFNMMGLL